MSGIMGVCVALESLVGQEPSRAPGLNWHRVTVLGRGDVANGCGCGLNGGLDQHGILGHLD